jgi:hypothetical protein
MEIITKYKAIDGVEFKKMDDCLEYEALIARVHSLMSRLKPRPENDGFAFIKGDGFIQHDKNTVLEIRKSLLEIAYKYNPMRWVKDSIESDDVHPSYAQSMIDETGIQPLINAWYRFSCMTHDFREFGQPYFRDNPEKAKQFNIYE